MKEAEIHGLWVIEWAIIEELSFLCNKHRRDPLIVAYLLHIHGYCYFYLKYYADLSWGCSGWYMHVDVLILDKHCYALCQLKN